MGTPLGTVTLPDTNLTPQQIKVIVAVERTGGALSLLSVLLIFLAYWLVQRVRNVQNTFIAFASISNIGASIASMVALDGVDAGQTAPLCQAQSFLFEMFMQSDPWWSLAMAINVFLVFYFPATPDSFQRWWWLYCLICYGGPFAIALSLLLVRRGYKELIYGEATIWCWIDSEWDGIRIYTYYMLIWICIVGSMILYFLVGYHVFQSRNKLRSFSTPKSKEAGHCGSPRVNHTPSGDGGFYGTVTTEVQIIRSNARHTPCPAEPKRCHARGSATHVSFDEAAAEAPSASSQYFSSVTSSMPRPPDGPQRKRSYASPFCRVAKAMRATVNKFVIEDPIKRAYLRTSLLFAVSVLVTWIPSSLNRIHGWLNKSSPDEYHIAAAAVLPLQGLWNGVIFFVTSWRSIKVAFRGGAREDRNRERAERAREMSRGLDRGVLRDNRKEATDDLDYAGMETGMAGSDVELTQVSRDRSLSV